MLFRTRPCIILPFACTPIPCSSCLFDFPPRAESCLPRFICRSHDLWSHVTALEIVCLEVIKLNGVLRVGPDPVCLQFYKRKDYGSQRDATRMHWVSSTKKVASTSPERSQSYTQPPPAPRPQTSSLYNCEELFYFGQTFHDLL